MAKKKCFKVNKYKRTGKRGKEHWVQEHTRCRGKKKKKKRT